MGGPAFSKATMHFAAAWHRYAPRPCNIRTCVENIQTSCCVNCLLFSPDEPRSAEIKSDQAENVYVPLGHLCILLSILDLHGRFIQFAFSLTKMPITRGLYTFKSIANTKNALSVLEIVQFLLRGNNKVCKLDLSDEATHYKF